MSPVIDLEAERQEILRQYRRLLRTAKPYLQSGDTKLIKKAFNQSLEAHKDMRRKSGEPYILHPLAVAQIAVEEIGLGTTSIVAALLHDVVEDTPTEISDVERDFGPKVARIVDGLTKISGVFEQGTSEQAENFRKMLLTLSEDVRVILIKLADRLHNMRTLDSMPRHKQLKIASETIYLYAPLAHRLGLYAIKTELEDLHLKYTDTDIYNDLKGKVKQSQSARNRFIKEFVQPIDEELKAQGFSYEIKGRPKSIYSILKKMRKQKRHLRGGVRLVCYPGDIGRAAGAGKGCLLAGLLYRHRLLPAQSRPPARLGEHAQSQRLREPAHHRDVAPRPVGGSANSLAAHG